MLLKLTGFDGLQPAVDSRHLPPNKATVALNARLVNGVLRPWQAPKYIMTLEKVGDIASIYRFGQDVSEELNYWLHWLTDVDVVRGPVADSGTERTYWTGDSDYPRYSYFPIVNAGTNLPAASYRLGIPRPENSPVAVAGAEPALEAVETSRPANVASVTRYDATTAEVTLSEPTDFDTSQPTKVIVSGATPTQFNGTHSVTWLDSTTFRYTASRPADDGGEKLSTQTLDISNIQRIDANTAQVALSAISEFIRTKATTITVIGCSVTQYNGTYTANWINETVIQYTPTKAGQSVSLEHSLTSPPFTISRISEFVVEIALTDATRFDTNSTCRVTVQNMKTPSMLNGTYDANWIDSQTLRFTTTSGVPLVPFEGTDDAPFLTVTITGPVVVDLPTTPAPSGVSAVTLSGTVSTELPAGETVTGVDEVYLMGMATPEDDRDREDRSYVVTFVSPLGEEGPNCPASNVVEVVASQSVSLTGLPVPPVGGGWNLPAEAKKRIYRSATSGTSAVYLFVDEVPIAQTTYEDTKEADELSEALPSEFWTPPPDDLKGLCILANGVMAGFKNNEVWFSEPNLPHAWPHMVALDYKVVGIGAFGNSLFVGTVGTPQILTGIDPAQMTPSKIPVEQSCVSKRSVCEVGGGVVYASPDGLCLADGSGIKVLTEPLMHPDQWRAYKPESMLCVAHENRVFAAYRLDNGTRGALVLDMSGGAALWETNIVMLAAYTDVSRDALYFVDNNRYLYRWNEGDTKLTYYWQSKLTELPFPANFGCGQVLADSYPVQLYVKHGDSPDEVEADSGYYVNVQSDRPFRLPGGFRARYWQARIEGQRSVYTVLMADTIEELARG